MQRIRVVSAWMIVGIVMPLVCCAAAETLTRDQAIELGIEAVQERLGAATAEITVGEVEAAEWPDSWLGCRQESVTSPEIVVSGYRLLLTADGREYTVHVGAGRALICSHPEEESISLLPDNQEHRALVGVAMSDLAARLEVPLEEIGFLGIRLVTWPDASLGCPRPGMNYTQATREGYQIYLRSGGRRYAYHSGLAGPSFFCERPTLPVDEKIDPGAGSDRNR